MNTFYRALKFQAFYRLNQLPFFQPGDYKNNEELFSNCPAPYPRGQARFKQFPTPGTEGLDFSRGLPGGWLQVELNHA